MRQARLVRRPPNRTSPSFPPEADTESDDAKATNAQLIANLKDQVQRAEKASEQYRKHLESLQQRLDESANEQTAAEERELQKQTELDGLRGDTKEAARRNRELELSFDSERRLLLQDREKQASKEAELQATITRLNEALRLKGLERSNTVKRSTQSIPLNRFVR